MANLSLRAGPGRIVSSIVFGIVATIAAVSMARADDHSRHEVLDPLPSNSRMQMDSGAGLFQSLDNPAQDAPSSNTAFVKRTRLVRFDASYRDRMLMAPEVSKAAVAAATGQDPVPATVVVFKLSLFADLTVTLYKTGMSTDSLGNTIWTGRILGAQTGEATLVFGHDQVSGSVRAGTHAFAIAPAADGTTQITEVNSNKRPHVDPLRRPGRTSAPLVSPAPADAATAAAAPVVEAAGTTITSVNLLIAYTPQALADDANISNSISLAVSYTNQVLSNSGINVQFNLVGTMEANYTESSGEGSSQILTDLTNGTGGFAAVQSQRNSLKADLVSVWTHFTDACGLSYILDDAATTPTSQEAPYGYNVITTAFGNDCLTDAVAHELGHNMGAKHDRYVDDPNDKLINQFNFGYVDVTHQFMTIMSYPNQCDDAGVFCSIIPYHSSPNLTYQGSVLGIADTSPHSSDNVREINAIAPYIAKFRSQSTTTTSLVSAILPSSRSVQAGHDATFFMTVINSGSQTATTCQLSGLAATDGSTLPEYNWTWQTTNSQTNQVTGSANTPVDIPAGGAQSFVGDVNFVSSVSSTLKVQTICGNASAPAVIAGVNTLQISVSANPVPDVIALAATPTSDGTLKVATGSAGAFAVATANVGVAGSILVSADTGSTNLPTTLTLCETDPTSGQCLAPPSATLTHTFAAGETPTFSIFAAVSKAITFNPATARIFVRFKDASGATVRGSTSVALRSP